MCVVTATELGGRAHTERATELGPEQMAPPQCTGVMAKRQCFSGVFFVLEFQIVYTEQ